MEGSKTPDLVGVAQLRAAIFRQFQLLVHSKCIRKTATGRGSSGRILIESVAAEKPTFQLKKHLFCVYTFRRAASLSFAYVKIVWKEKNNLGYKYSLWFSILKCPWVRKNMKIDFSSTVKVKMLSFISVETRWWNHLPKQFGIWAKKMPFLA
jgi:hypothetical protein